GHDWGHFLVRKPFAAHRRIEKAHVNVIAKPKRKCYVPPIPKIADVPGEKRAIEVFRSMDTEKITQGDCKSAVAGKIKKQIEAVCIHVADQRGETPAAGGSIQPVLFDERGEDEFVKEPSKNAMYRSVEIDKEFLACSPVLPLACEALEAVDWPG